MNEPGKKGKKERKGRGGEGRGRKEGTHGQMNGPAKINS